MLSALMLLPAANAHADGGVRLLDLAPGSPTSIDAGALWTTRVQLMTALTPPPGVQQARALREWSVELTGTARGVASVIEHCYPLPIANVRPETGTSLVYRVQVWLPAWIAPGLYDLRLTAPGGVAHAIGALRVRGLGDGAQATPGEWIGLRAGEERLLGLPAQATLRWYPGTPVGSRVVAPTVVAWLPSAVASRAALKVGSPPPSTVTLRVDPPPRAGMPSTLSVEGAHKHAQLAWSLADGTHRLGGARVRHLFRASGSERAHVLVINPDGAATAIEATLRVRPGQRFACQLSPVGSAPLQAWGAGASPSTAGWLAAPLILALALLKRRPRKTPGID